MIPPKQQKENKMSCSLCIKCEGMVPMYEKYCQKCINEYGVAQDALWHKIYHPWGEREKEFEKDLKKALGGE